MAEPARTIGKVTDDDGDVIIVGVDHDHMTVKTPGEAVYLDDGQRSQLRALLDTATAAIAEFQAEYGGGGA